MMNSGAPISEQYGILGQDWAAKESAASLLEDSKSAWVAQRQAMLGGGIPVNKAEQIVKASPEYAEYIKTMVNARKEANLAKIRLEVKRMEFQEWISKDANARQEAKLT